MGVSDVVKSLMNLEVYIYVVLAVGSFLVVFGQSRRRYNNAFLRFLTMVVFNSSFALITLVVGQMVSIRTEYTFLFPFWAAYLVLFHGLSDTITAHSLEDNEQWKRSYFNLYVALVWVGVVGLSSMVYRSLSSGLQNPFLHACIISVGVNSAFHKGVERIKALKNGTKNGVAIGSKPVADLMNLPAGSAYRNYLLVTGKFRLRIDGEEVITEDREKVITVGKVWSCQGRLLSEAGDPDSKMKDLCLSFSMYKLLCCHFGGYSFPQSSRDGQMEFVRSVLLHEDVGAGESYQRPFRLIEVELGFLYDHLYTKYAVMFHKDFQIWKLIFFVFAAVSSVLVQRFVLIPSKKMDRYTRVTRVIIGVFMSLEALQILLYAVSNWGKLFCLCKYVGKPSWRRNNLYEQFVQLVCSFPSSRLWGRQLGQYTFLKSCTKSPPWWIYNLLSGPFLENPGKGRAGSSFVPLSPQVQRVVLAWIKQNGRRLTKGRASLIDNGVGNEDLLSACEFQVTTRVIMVWHIATSLCEFQHRKTSRPFETFEVAVALSKYCAYLVAFAPRLLPDHYVDTNELFDEGVSLGDLLLKKGCKSMEDKYNELMNSAEIVQSLVSQAQQLLQVGQQTDFVTAAGVRVAKLLMEEVGDDEERLWKILADFWTEMVLFVAPCDDPWPHAEHLAQGGEFVTHLMALLFHAGVAKREFIEDAAMPRMNKENEEGKLIIEGREDCPTMAKMDSILPEDIEEKASCQDDVVVDVDTIQSSTDWLPKKKEVNIHDEEFLKELQPQNHASTFMSSRKEKASTPNQNPNGEYPNDEVSLERTPSQSSLERKEIESIDTHA